MRQRYEKLEQQDIPAVSPTNRPPGPGNENANEDNNDNDNDRETMQEVVNPEVQQPARQGFPHRRLGINTVLI